ncbi:hypothetical protein HIM_05401 [Hirsutella minnesotensis 3608]|uniref:MFS maltose permease n=1 Tax=Hirsutella minnesotensis 3608 TaxID=1043627 RepID=A0A0F8A0B8_9HYPO|nr:hypothetical protein HIM_05401 [Hirsutella minnesotensis 3608]
MRSRLVVRRIARSPPPRPHSPLCRRAWSSHSTANSVKARPVLPFLAAPKTSPSVARSFTSERKRWLRHEAKLVVRYTVSLWGIIAAVLVINFALGEEKNERDFPTPPEWGHMTRKFLRDANKARDPSDGTVDWATALGLARAAVLRLQAPSLEGQDVTKLSKLEDPTLENPDEFIHCDISAKSEEWRRGYFEAMMLAAKAAEHVDGWLRDRTRNLVCPPEFVIGPSNPRPRPIPAGSPHAPREEDCEQAFPTADNWYMKLLATKGLAPRQTMEATLEYAGYLEYKGQLEGAESLYNMALAEATQGMPPFSLPYDPKTLVLKDGVAPASMNILDALTAIANFKARNGNVSSALPMYISLLKTRRTLSDTPPAAPRQPRKRLSLYQQITAFFTPPEYPPPPPSGFQPPWRSPKERCQEASLLLNIGEVLYATSSKSEGLAWTRDGVDLAEEQLRALGSGSTETEAKKSCRECLGVGLSNWSTMVSRLAFAEEEKKKYGSKSTMFSLWSGAKEPESRWAAEEAVVKERLRRTKELMEDLTPPESGIASWFRA